MHEPTRKAQGWQEEQALFFGASAIELIDASRVYRWWDSQYTANCPRPDSRAGALVYEMRVGCVRDASFAFDNELQYRTQNRMPRRSDDRPLAEMLKVFESDSQGLPTHLP